MADNKKKLYIPVPIVRRKEKIKGVGSKEITQIIIAIIVGIIIGIILFFLNNNNPLFLIMTIFASGSAAFIFLRKDATNRSTIDKVKLYIDFIKSQKRFYYKYVNIYEKDKECK